MAEDSFNPEAKAWIDNVNLATGMSAGWRLEFLGKRYKPNRKPAANRAPLKIRRFVRGLPWALVHDAIRYLMSQAPYSGIIYNGVAIPGEFRPTSTRWVRDDQERVDGQATGSYTLVQDLIEDGVTDEFSIPSGGSCSEEVVTEWRWDDPEVVDVNTLPEYGHQGVSYSIQAVRRDDAGGFEYAIVKRKAKTQFTGWVTTECTEFETIETATWDNVYGGIGGDVYDTQGYESIPVACEDEKGVTVTLNVTENSDCTFRITAQRRAAKRNIESETTSSQTVFETTSQTSTQASSSLGAAPSPTEGTYVTRESKLRPDGLFDVSEKTVKEKRVTSSRKSVRKTLRGIITTTTDRNTTNNSTTVSNVGDEVVIEKNPGGTWNRTVTQINSAAIGTVATDCQNTVFEHQHSDTINQKLQPSGEAVAAGSGKVTALSARQTEEGTWDVTTRTTTEQKQPNSRKTVRKTLRGVVTTTTDRNTTDSSTSVTKVGDEVTIEKTPGGLWNRTKTQVTASTAGVVSTECEHDIFTHKDSTTTNQTTAGSTHAQTPGGGKSYTTSARQTEEGTWDVTTKVVTERSVPSVQRSYRKELHGLYTTITSKSTSAAAGVPATVGGSTESKLTPGGLYDTSETTFSPIGCGLVSKASTTDYFSKTDSSIDHKASGVPSIDTTFSAGNVKTKEYRVLDDGTIHSTTTTETATSRQNSEIRYTCSPNGVEKVTRWVNSDKSANEMELRSLAKDGANVENRIGESETLTYNKFGRADYVKVERFPAKFTKWEAVIDDMRYEYIHKVWFINASKDDYEDLFAKKQDAWSKQLEEWADGDSNSSSSAPSAGNENTGYAVPGMRPFSSASVTPEVRYTEWGKYDGSITLTVRWSSGSAGRNGTVEKLFFEHWTHTTSPEKGSKQYTYKTYQAMGRGLKELDRIMKSQHPDNNSAGYSTDFSYSPTSGEWTYKISQTVENKVNS